MKTFIYKGDGDALLALNSRLEKGKPFPTDDPAVIALLSATKDVEEVSERAEPKKPSRKPDAVEP